MVTTVADIHAAAAKNLIRLRGSIQQYGWGKQGSQSMVAQLGRNGIGGDFTVSEEQYYAEVRIEQCRSLYTHSKYVS